MRTGGGNTSNTFARRPSFSASDEEDYGAVARKTKRRAGGGGGSQKERSVREFELPRLSSRDGKQLPNYNEAAMDFGLTESEDEYEGYGGAAEEKGASLVLFLEKALLGARD